MSKQELNILNKLGELGMKDTELLGGTVVAGSVDEKKMTCSVRILMLDADVPDVLLNVNTSNVKGIVAIPEDSSNVWVSWIEGQLCVLKAAKVKKVMIDVPQVLVSCPDVQFNEGKNGGLIIIQKLVDKINRLEKKVDDITTKHNGLETSFNAHTHAYSPGPGTPTPTAPPIPISSNSSTPIGTPTKKSDIENTKIKH